MASVNPILLESFERWSLVQTMLDKVSEYMRLKMKEPSFIGQVFNLEAAIGRAQYEMLPDSKIAPLSIEVQPGNAPDRLVAKVNIPVPMPFLELDFKVGPCK
jgi:hypothetical protein